MCGFVHSKRRILTRISSLYGSQIWPIVLCMYNSVFSIRITSLYGSKHSSADFDCKTASFGTELKVSMGPRPHQSFCAYKTAWLTPESLVSMGFIAHRWFLNAKHRIWALNTSLYVSQTWPVVLCMYNSLISITNTSLYGSQPSSEVFACKTATSEPD